MKTRPKVAVFMPSYNHEKYVAEAIDSVLAQTYDNWELFIADDASTDNTAKIVSSYKDDRIHVHLFKENTAQAGVLAFLSNLIKDTDCDYISCLASDDVYKPDKMERQVNFLEEHSEYKACFAWDTVIMEEGAWENYGRDMCHSRNKSRYDWIRSFYHIGNHISANTMMMRKETYVELGTMNGKFLQLADYRLWFRCSLRYPFYIIEDELIYYRRHSDNLSNPSLEQVMRGMHENYSILSYAMDNIGKEAFYHTFYQDVPYKTSSSEHELLADKMMLLINSGESLKEELALNMYYKAADDNGLSEALKARYFFKEADFKKLYGNLGMGYLCNELFGQKIMEQTKSDQYLPLYVLLNCIDAGKMTKDTISDFTYNSLRGVYFAAESLNNPEMFVKIKEHLFKVRREKSYAMPKKSCMIMISSISKRPLPDILKHIRREYEHIYYYIMGTREENALGKIAGPFEDAPDNTEYLDLFDRTNISVRFADEVVTDLTDIYYVDFVGEEYEYAEMTAGFSLGVSQHFMAHKDVMGFLSSIEKEALQIMDEIIQT